MYDVPNAGLGRQDRQFVVLIAKNNIQQLLHSNFNCQCSRAQTIRTGNISDCCETASQTSSIDPEQAENPPDGNSISLLKLRDRQVKMRRTDFFRYSNQYT